MVVALLSCLSFIPAQWLLQSDSLQAMFQFGWPEVLAFLLLQLPLAAGLGALLMALAIRSKTFKEAQAGSALVITLVGTGADGQHAEPRRRCAAGICGCRAWRRTP